MLKVGTNAITNTEGNLDTEEMGKLAHQIAVAMKQGDKVVLVTSGAVAAGIAELGNSSKAQRRGFSASSRRNGTERFDGKVPGAFQEI